MKKERQKRIAEFESKQGSINFIKLYLSSLSQLLIQKGIITEDELWVSLENQIDKFEEKHQAKMIELMSSGRVNVNELEGLAKSGSNPLSDLFSNE
jgi:hypothetical protein